MGKPYLERFFEILEDADKLIKGELAPPRTTEEEKLKAKKLSKSDLKKANQK